MTSMPSRARASFFAPRQVTLACAQLCLTLCLSSFATQQARACDDCPEHKPAPASTAATPAAATGTSTSASADGSAAPTHKLGLVLVSGSATSSLPSNIPTTLESITGVEIARSINATDAEDALKYLPSLLVRKRYIGDYNHAVLSTRASGTGNSARSLVYADGIPLSNLLGNGATFTPRWGMVTPEEIERVDVLYGPFSAAYSGNSAGAVVDYQTRSPKALEAHVSLGLFSQPFELYSSKATYQGRQASASIGSKTGPLSWWINVNHLDSDGQPLTFITKPLSTTAAGAGATVVTGAVPGLDKSNMPWLIIGAGTQYNTVQDHAKLKLKLELTPELSANAVLGWWGNETTGSSTSYLRDSSGAPFYAAAANSGTLKPSTVSIDGKAYALASNDFGQNRDSLRHQMQGLSIKSNGRGVFDFELSASSYHYDKDQSRSPLTARPGADSGGAGRIADLAGTGWNTLAAKAVLRASGSAHVIDLGAQQENYHWQQNTSNANDWREGAPSSLFTAFSGRSRLSSVYAQDAWSISPQLKTVLGLRLEDWQAADGMKTAANGTVVTFARRSEQYASPKAAIGYELNSDWALRLSTGRAVRMPTVGELYQGGVNANGVYVPADPSTNPNLKPEQGWTTELSATWVKDNQQLRSTLFHEDTRDALYAQLSVDPSNASKTVSSVQNIDRVRTRGFELAYLATDLGFQGLDLQASLTYADSTILANSGFVSVPGDTIGKQQPRVPKWRSSALLSYQLAPALAASYGLRYASSQYGTLNNSDPNGFAYQGFSSYFTTDLRLQWKLAKQWTLAGGVDNLNNALYWNFHPYPQRTYHAELKFDL
nr:TonB-dependent receptor [uncultured Roseateles sp.]